MNVSAEYAARHRRDSCSEILINTTFASFTFRRVFHERVICLVEFSPSSEFLDNSFSDNVQSDIVNVILCGRMTRVPFTCTLMCVMHALVLFGLPRGTVIGLGQANPTRWQSYRNHDTNKERLLPLAQLHWKTSHKNRFTFRREWPKNKKRHIQIGDETKARKKRTSDRAQHTHHP